MKIIVVFVVFVCLVSLAAAPPEAKTDPQSAYEPRGAPGAGQKFLEKFVGEWDVAKSFHPQSGEPVKTSGTCRQAMTQGGRFLQSDFVFGQGETRSTGQGLIGFEPDTGLFTSVWTDSRQTRMSFRQSRDPFDGEQIVLFSRTLDAGGGGEGKAKNARRSRTVSRLEDGGRRLVHRQYNLGAQGEERLMMELVMTRK